MISLIIMASAPQQATSSLERLSAIVAPYTRCEVDGKARLEPLANEWSAAAQASRKMPDDQTLKTRDAELFKRLQSGSQAIREECGYERVHEELRARIAKLHPRMTTSDSYWFARAVFSTLNDLNEHVVKFERGEFPLAPVAPR